MSLISGKEDLFSFYPKELKRPPERIHPLTTEVIVVSDQPIIKLILGNSGFWCVADIGDRAFALHFQPDGDSDASENLSERLRRTVIFAGALYSFLMCFKDKKASYPKIAGNVTNMTMAAVIKNLLGPEHYEEEYLISDDMIFIKYEFHIESIRKDEDLMARLKKMHEWLQKLDYKMTKSVEDSLS